MATYELHVAGSERYAKLSSFRAELQVNGHDNIIAFILPTEGSPEVRFNQDEDVELLKDSVPIAAGQVTHVGEEMEPEGGPSNNGRFLSRITVSGYGEIATRRHVTMSIAGGSPGTSVSDILQDLIDMTDGLGDDGVTLHPSQEITRTVTVAMAFEDELPSAILNRLALFTGQVWRIDEQKRLRMWAKGDIAAAFDIDEDDLPAMYFGDIRPSRARFEGYANRVIVKGTKQTILDYGESFTSTGVETSFTTTVPMLGTRQSAVGVTNVPSLGVPVGQTFWDGSGLSGSGAHWEYSIDPVTNLGTFTWYQGALPSGAVVRLVFDGEISPRGVANDLADQALFPVRDEIVHAPVTTDAEAQALADQILPYLVSAKETKAEYSSRETDIIWPGVTQNMAAPRRGLSGAFLVTRTVLRSGPGEMNSYLVQDIENTLNDVLKGDWRDLVNQSTVGPSGDTTTGGGGDSNNNGGDTITNPDGDGGSGSNLNIPPEDTDIIFNKFGALGTHRTAGSPTQGQARILHTRVTGGSPATEDMFQMVLTALHTNPFDSLQVWKTPDDGAVSMITWDLNVYEQIFGGEVSDFEYVARSQMVTFLSHLSQAGADPGAGHFMISVLPNQTPGALMDFSQGRPFNFEPEGTFNQVDVALGTGAKSGRGVIVGRNTSGNGAPGWLLMRDKGGTERYLWFDTTGDLRTATAPPQEDGSPSDTSGVVVGSQS